MSPIYCTNYYRDEEAIKIIKEASRSSVTELNLSGICRYKIPLEIGTLTNLKSLDLSNNHLNFEYGLTDFQNRPGEISKLHNLQSLDLSGNLFKFFPEGFFMFEKLEVLNLSNTGITEIPSEIFSLTRLKKLSLGNNPISFLPKEIGKLSNLTHLDLNSNSITSLPVETKRLKLEFLDIRNDFKNVKSKIINILDDRTDRGKSVFSSGGSEADHKRDRKNKELMEKFREDLVRYEGELPIFNKSEFARIRKKLDEWNIIEVFLGNQLSIPPEILEKTNEPQTILNYYFNLLGLKVIATSENATAVHADEKVYVSVDRKTDKSIVFQGRSINQIKLLFIGQGSVGKTSLVQQICFSNFNQNQNKTDGISINQWQLNDVKFNIWDFGGQEIMHATHQFFLTKRSLYLLVLDSRLTQEENRVEYWLKIIQSFSDESPILIVGNKIDQHPLDIDRTGLQKKYPNIVGILETSAATGAGIEELKASIAEQVNNLPHVRDLLPETWFTVKTKLEELGRQSNFITHDKYLDLCAENEVSDDTSQRTLIGFLHDLGVVLHFQDDPRLEALGILNPQWVTNGVYKILNSHALFQNKGVLTPSMLDEILNLPEYPRGKRLFIVDMMKKFELCYDIEPDKIFLVPDLLPKDQPDLKFNGVPAFEYAYPVLPSSVITRFIVRMNQHICDGFVWRTGALLQIGNNTALVKADIEDRKITIAIEVDKSL